MYFMAGLGSLNFMRTGDYSCLTGNIFARITNNYLWSSTSHSDTYGMRLGASQTNATPQANDFRGFGFAIRCTIRVE